MLGKSSLAIQFVDNHFVDSYEPTIENSKENPVLYFIKLWKVNPEQDRLKVLLFISLSTPECQVSWLLNAIDWASSKINCIIIGLWIYLLNLLYACSSQQCSRIMNAFMVWEINSF